MEQKGPLADCQGALSLSVTYHGRVIVSIACCAGNKTELKRFISCIYVHFRE